MSQAFVIFPGKQSWTVARMAAAACQLAPVDIQGLELTCESAQALRKSLDDLGYSDEAVLLALPSEICLCAKVDQTRLRPRTREATLRFRLEEQLPLAMEDLVADFVLGNQTGQEDLALGVAVAAGTLAPMIQLLESVGINISSVCPAAFLVMQEMCQRSAGQTYPVNVVVCSQNGQLDLMVVEGDQIRNWSMLPANAASIRLHLNHLAMSRSTPLSILGVGLSPELREQIAASANIQLTEPTQEEPLALAASAAAKILSGISQAPVELRRDQLASADPLRQVRTPMRAAVIAAVLFSISLAGSMLWRAHQYNRLAETARLSQEQAFHRALPRQAPPLSITSRLASEEKRLRGLSGTASALPPSLTVLPLLRDTLGGLPAGLRFRLLELRFEPQRLYLEGQTLDHSGADQIAASLRRGTGLLVDPPHTEQPAGEDVTFTISASSSSSASSASQSGASLP